MRVAIHQPNFLPWLGYFNKIILCDIFVILDDVEMPKGAGTWSNRVKILSDSQPKWLSLPIKRSSGANLINSTDIAASEWKAKCVSKIDFAYRKSPYHRQIMNLVEDVFSSTTMNLSLFNCESILKIISFLEIDPPTFVKSSDFSLTSKATDRLIDLVKQVGGNEYLCGGGSSSYLETEKFIQEKIMLTFQNFEAKHYAQLSEADFIPGLSVIDSLMMNGPIKTLNLIIAT